MKEITRIKLTNFKDITDDMSPVAISYLEKKYDKEGAFSHVEECDISLKNFFAHDDLIDVFRRLSSQLAYITDQITDIQESHSVVCNQIIIRGEDEREGIILCGARKLRNGMVINLTSPFFVFAQNNDYEYIEELYNCLQDATTEARLIFSQNKSKIQQLELELR